MDKALTDKLAAWDYLCKRIAMEVKPLIEQEREMRKELFAELFPAPGEGTNTLPLDAGYVVKATYPLERKVDQAAVDQLRSLKVADLSPALFQSLHLQGEPNLQANMLVVQALSLNIDELLEYKPSLKLKQYRELTAEQSILFDRCLEVKPGSISMEIVLPARRVAAGDKAKGF